MSIILPLCDNIRDYIKVSNLHKIDSNNSSILKTKAAVSITAAFVFYRLLYDRVT